LSGPRKIRMLKQILSTMTLLWRRIFAETIFRQRKTNSLGLEVLSHQRGFYAWASMVSSYVLQNEGQGCP
jgi:hypothetical protein